MKDYAFLVLIVLVKALVSLTDDVSSIISCDMVRLTWQEAVGYCKDKGGYMLPFETGLGQNIDRLPLKRETDVWTADYLTVSDNGADNFCGFNYLNNKLYEINGVFYGDCNANRNYFCKNETADLVIYNSTRENVQCKYNVSETDLQRMKSQIKPGYYWTSGRLNGTVATPTPIENFILKSSTGGKPRVFCGAYSSSIGRYFAACTMKRFSLCTHYGNKSNSEQCFEGQTAKVTEHTAIVTKTMETPMTSRSEITADTSAASTKQPMKVLTSDEDNTNVKRTYSQEEEQNSDIGMKVGVPLGIILPLTCGVLIIIYIYRKRQMNQFHTHETSHAHGQLNVYSENIQDTSISSERHTNENNLTDISAQYAVVKKPNKGDSKSRKDDYSNKPYQNATNDEYDVAERFRSCRSNPSDNLYNHFESVADYNSTSLLRKEGECNNLYNTTGDNNLGESAYDSTTQVNNTALSDDVYIHLSQDDNYNDSTSNTRNK